MTTHKYARGFTLIEIAVGLFLLTILLGSLLVPLSSQVETRQLSETRQQLEVIKEALIGFSVVNGYLPCPDLTSGANSNDGYEDVSSGRCSVISSDISAGNLPWATLGVAPTDLWGNRYRYVLSERYARRTPDSTFTINSSATYVRVCNSSTTCGTPITANAIAVVLSHGSNQFGAIQALTGTQIPSSSAGTDESENINDNRDIVQRISTTNTTGGGAFDDIVDWLPQYVLINRMVSAGKLP